VRKEFQREEIIQQYSYRYESKRTSQGIINDPMC
jgi:hypothetical protein